MNYRWYDHLASSVRVRDIMVTRLVADANLPVRAAVEFLQDLYLRLGPLGDDQETVAIVADSSGSTIGWVSVAIAALNESRDATLQDVAQSIALSNVIEASATLDVAVRAFAHSENIKPIKIDFGGGHFLHKVPLFVLDGTRFTGILSYSKLTVNAAFRGYLFMLTLALEQWVLELCALDPKTSFLSLSANRRKAARQRTPGYRESKLSQRRMFPPACFLPYTMFSDKGIMFAARNDLAGWSRTQFKKFWHRAEDVRNATAHTRGEEEDRLSQLSAKEMVDFIDQVGHLISTIRGRINALGGDRSRGSNLRLVT